MRNKFHPFYKQKYYKYNIFFHFMTSHICQKISQLYFCNWFLQLSLVFNNKNISKKSLKITLEVKNYRFLM
jgi:hypothetical protein